MNYQDIFKIFEDDKSLTLCFISDNLDDRRIVLIYLINNVYLTRYRNFKMEFNPKVPVDVQYPTKIGLSFDEEFKKNKEKQRRIKLAKSLTARIYSNGCDAGKGNNSPTLNSSGFN